jgi:hypothetical protein
MVGWLGWFRRAVYKSSMMPRRLDFSASFPTAH